jgi:hypothetical protein
LRLLGVALLGAAAGCRPTKKSDDARRSSPETGPTPGRASSATAPPSQALAARVADDERALIAAYDTAIAAQPALTSTLAPLRAEHAAHLVGLTPGAPTTPANSSSTSATPTPSVVNPSVVNPSVVNPSVGGPSGSPAGSPGQSPHAETLADLAARERAAAAARVDDLMSSDDGSLARLLASIGGCEAAHAALLAAAS